MDRCTIPFRSSLTLGMCFVVLRTTIRYSTMMILNHIHNKPSYCIDMCQRGRVEDGSFMVRVRHRSYATRPVLLHEKCCSH